MTKEETKDPAKKQLYDDVMAFRKTMADAVDILTKAKESRETGSVARREDFFSRQIALYFELNEMQLGVELTLVANGIRREALLEKAKEERAKLEPEMVAKIKETQEKDFERRLGGAGG